MVTVDDVGVATSLRGNPEHPFSAGELCKKVHPWLSYASEPGRLMAPKRRVGPKGSGRFVDIGWDEALAEIADRFATIIKRSGPAAIWPFAGTGNVGFLQGGAGPAGARLWDRLGVSDHEITICSTSGHHGLAYTLGTSATLDPVDIVRAGLVLIWGSNTMVTNRHLWPYVRDAQRAGAPVVVIDPVRTRTAARADVHLAPRPGTDGALAAGLMHTILARGGGDEGYGEAKTLGWHEFTSSLQPWTPERTAKVCGLTPAEIISTAELIVASHPLAVKVGQGLQRHAGGGQTTRLLSCLPALTGAYGERGGGLFYSTSGYYGLNTGANNNTSSSSGDSASRPRSLAMTNLAVNLLELDDPPVEALFVYGANPVVSNPDVEAVRRGLSRPDLFTVVVDIFETETSSYADLVLPSTMQHEHYEMNDSFSHLYLNWNEPAVAPPGQCLSHTEIFRRLAGVMGFDDPDLQADDLTLAEALLDTKRFRDAGVSLDQLRAKGWIRLPGTDGDNGSSFAPVREAFPTPSGRFEFASDRAMADGHGRLPTPVPGQERAGDSTRGSARESSGGYALIAAASDWHINSTFAGTSTIRERTGVPVLRINPADAARDGLVDGVAVWVTNDRGSFRAQLAIAGDVRPGVAATTKGWWAMDVNATVREQDSDMGRGAIFHDNRVTIDAVL